MPEDNGITLLYRNSTTINTHSPGCSFLYDPKTEVVKVLRITLPWRKINEYSQEIICKHINYYQ